MRAVLVSLALVLSLTDLVSAQEPAPRRRRRRMSPEQLASSWRMRRKLEKPWALKGVHVVDVVNGGVLEDVNVIIDGDLIRSVGKDEVPEAIEAVEGMKGCYVVPGFMDLHAHVVPEGVFGSPAPEAQLTTLLDHGVTTIRLLPLLSESSVAWAARVNRGELEGPTIIPASTVYEKEPQRGASAFGDAATVRGWVRKDALIGVRWIKIYNKMDEESLRAIVETARPYGIRVCGHAEGVPPLEASRIGQATVEHMVDIARSALRKGLEPRQDVSLLEKITWHWNNADDGRLEQLMSEFRKNGTGWIPTLTVVEKIIEGGSHDGRRMGDAAALRDVKRALVRGARLAVLQHRAGGLVGLGTDFPVDGVKPGTSVHREMELLVELGGARPLEALQIASIGSARILGFEDLLGSVEVGKLAHLVVLEKNPLDDIRNVGSIKLVVQDGRRHAP